MSKPSTLHAQLYAEMVHRIRTGVWKPGERVPSEKSLIEEFGTSRGPVRQALAALRTEGMIVGGRGAPPRVQRVAPAQSFDTFMSFTEWARELGLTPGQRVVEVSRRRASEEVSQQLQIGPDSPVVEVIRLRLLEGRPAMLERSLFPPNIGTPLLTADLETSSIYQTLARQRVIPVRAEHVIDAIEAKQLEHELLEVNLGAPLLRVRRVSYDEYGAVLETADDRYLPSMANFKIENTADHRIPFTREAAGHSADLFATH